MNMRNIIRELFMIPLSFVPITIILGTSNILIGLWYTIVWISILLFAFALTMTFVQYVESSKYNMQRYERRYKAAIIIFIILDFLVNQIFGHAANLQFSASALYTDRLKKLKANDVGWRGDWARIQCNILSSIQNGKHC